MPSAALADSAWGGPVVLGLLVAATAAICSVVIWVIRRWLKRKSPEE